jgi:methyltransferase (TIGR00027 family)
MGVAGMDDEDGMDDGDDGDDGDDMAAVASTAITLAICRAQERHRPSPWFYDPLADYVERFAEAAPEKEIRPGLTFWVAVRTRFLDELVLDATSKGVEQIVLLGAGLDARAFRLPLPQSVTVFEVDRASVLTLKRRLLAELGLPAAVGRREVVADLARPDWLDALRATGWTPDRPTCWIAEGLLVYLGAAARDALVATLAAVSAPGSRLGVTATTQARAEQVELFRSGLDQGPEHWLSTLGWRGVVNRLPRIADRYGRPLRRGAEPDAEKATQDTAGTTTERASAAMLIDAVPIDRSAP